jgi:hypothetical protein
MVARFEFAFLFGSFDSLICKFSRPRIPLILTLNPHPLENQRPKGAAPKFLLERDLFATHPLDLLEAHRNAWLSAQIKK